MANFDDTIKQLNDEIASEKDRILKGVLTELMQSFQFTSSNISPELLSKLMATRDVKIPPPSKKPIPEAADDGDQEIKLINYYAPAIFEDLMIGNNVYLYGKAGTGKTYLAKQVARLFMQRPYKVLNCNQFTSPIDIKGGQTIEGYTQGVLSECWEKGFVLILDELPKLDPNTAGILNEALASATEQDKEFEISKDKYNYLKKQVDEAAGEFIGFELSVKDGKYYQHLFPTMTDGRGVKLKKHPYFCVIATGNTNMKEISSNFTGNNRQDYSLVDRFAGSYYKIDYEPAVEQKMIFKAVLDVSYELRTLLDADPNSVESISLRTMLNFNRIYVQEYLRALPSPLAQDVVMIDGKAEGRTFKAAVESFIATLPEGKRQDIDRKTQINQLLAFTTPLIQFVEEYKNIYGVDPITGKPIKKND